MNLLTQFNQRHPLGTSCLGIAGSVSGWFFAHVSEINLVIGVLGGCLGLLIGILTVEAKFHALKMRRRRRRWLRDEFEPDRIEDDLNY